MHSPWIVPAAFLFLLASNLHAGEDRDLPVKTLRGHHGPVRQVAFSPDGSLLATAGLDGAIKLWRILDGTVLADLSGQGGGILSVAFSPDGGSLLSGSEDKTLKLRDVPGARAVRIASHEGPVRDFLLSHHGKRLISAGDRAVRIWNRADGKEVLAIRNLPAAPRCLAESPGGKYLAASFPDQTVRLYLLTPPPPPPPPRGEALDLIRPGESWRYHKGTSPPGAGWQESGFDDSSWTSGESGFGYSSNPQELKTVKTRIDDMGNQFLSFYIRKIFEVSHPDRLEKMELKILYDDGFVAYLNGAEVGRANVDGAPPGHDRTARSTGEPQETTINLTPFRSKLTAGKNVLAIQGHNGSRTSSDFILTPRLQVVVKSPPPEPREPQKAGSEVRRIEGLGAPAVAVAFDLEGTRIAAATDTGVIGIYSIQDGSPLARLEGPGGLAGGIGFLRDGKLAAGCADGKIRLWDVGGKKVAPVLEGYEGPVADLCVGPAGRLLLSCGPDGSNGQQGTVRLWDSASGKEIRRFPAHQGQVLSAGLGPDGKVVVTGSSSGALQVFSAGDGKLLRQYLHKEEIRLVAASSDDHYYFAGPGNDILEWSLGSGSVRRTFKGHLGIVHSVAISPDGLTAASGSADGTIRLWDLASGRQLRYIRAHPSSVFRVVFSPDGKTVASGGFDMEVKLWSVRDGSRVRSYQGHQEGVFCLAFTSDGDFLLSGSSDGTIRKWSTGDEKPGRTFRGHSGWICDLKTVPGTARLISCDYDGNLIIWDLESGAVLLKKRLHATLFGLDVSPHGKWMATANQEGTSFLLEVPPAAR